MRPNHLVCWYACSQPSKIEVLKFFIMVIHNPLPKVLLCNFHVKTHGFPEKKHESVASAVLIRKTKRVRVWSFESLCPSTLYRQIIIWIQNEINYYPYKYGSFMVQIYKIHRSLSLFLLSSLDLLLSWKNSYGSRQGVWHPFWRIQFPSRRSECFSML